LLGVPHFMHPLGIHIESPYAYIISAHIVAIK
jgi:hypothetical protein